MSISEITRRLIAAAIRFHYKALNRDCKLADKAAQAAKRAHLQAIAVCDAAVEAEVAAEEREAEVRQNALAVQQNAAAERAKYGY